MAFGAVAASAAPSVMGMLMGEKQTRYTPMIVPTMNAQQMQLLGQLSRSGAQLTPEQNSILSSMLQGGTAGDYSTGAENAYYENSLKAPALAKLQNTTLPSLGTSMAKSYWSSARPKAQNAAISSTYGDLQNQYSDLMGSTDMARKAAAEKARLYGMQGIANQQNLLLGASPYSIAYSPQ